MWYNFPIMADHDQVTQLNLFTPEVDLDAVAARISANAPRDPHAAQEERRLGIIAMRGDDLGKEQTGIGGEIDDLGEILEPAEAIRQMHAQLSRNQGEDQTAYQERDTSKDVRRYVAFRSGANRSVVTRAKRRR